MGSESRYLLIIACSQRKRLDAGEMSAIARYDGGHFRVLRKAQRDGYWSNNLDVLILSAKYGLIEACTPIANYEQRMNCKRASELKAQVTQALQTYARLGVYCEVYVDLGQDYLPAIEGLADLFKGLQVTYADGRIGERLKWLKHWLKAKCEG
ncbi:MULTISPECIES: DUF6884 domain-containing protein [Cyanophyceae]|uniref:DUF6884 domain-containing protein n=1 Tax=Cyanophyceae TaxID=3028117 RepID=UPI0016878BEA|nr:DUF6884 domain-containing protein [Trichocoleus sp. FACHB-69]MBD1932503.1 peroxide stress protein YaaA [Trichocoleus sp. FACHB-69]